MLIESSSPQRPRHATETARAGRPGSQRFPDGSERGRGAGWFVAISTDGAFRQGTSGYAEEFAVRGPTDSRGRSLRDLDLRSGYFVTHSAS